MKKIILVTLIIFVVTFLQSCVLNIPSNTDINLSLIELPFGFEISIFADVPGARSLAKYEDIIFVGTRSEGKVYAIYKGETKIIASGLNSPNGVAVKENDLYIAEIDKIIRIKNIKKSIQDNEFDYEIVYDKLPNDTHHGWKYISFGPDGLLYIPVGAPCNICNPDLPYASLSKLNVTSGNFEVVARGIRNTVGFDWDLENNLWFTDNGRDFLGDELPPDEINMINESGNHFGYPFCHGNNISDPEFGSDNCSKYTPPIVELGAHVAALGIEIYNGEIFPENYKNKIFIAEHGSWNRRVPIGYRITLVNPDDKSYQVFASGWLNSDGEAFGRPVDVLELDDGSILISDDRAGLIYQITYN